MANGNLLLKAIRIAYPDAIRRGDGKPFTRPEAIARYLTETESVITDTSGWFWQNIDGDRFYFTSPEECAADLAQDIDMDADEARRVLAARKAENRKLISTALVAYAKLCAQLAVLDRAHKEELTEKIFRALELAKVYTA